MTSEQILSKVTDDTITREFGNLTSDLINLVPQTQVSQHGVYQFVSSMGPEAKISKLQQLVMLGKRAEAILQL